MADIDLKQFVLDVPDFPKPGVVFKDITPLLNSPSAYDFTIGRMAEAFRDTPVDLVLGVESRGFFFGAPLALRMGKGFIPIRKPGKLPRERISASYQLEYGIDALEMHRDAVGAGHRVILVDDVLATGGTICACAELVRQLGGNVVGFCFLMELEFLKGREKLQGENIVSLIRY
jgi:adenine phosphoribosyltransferase